MAAGLERRRGFRLAADPARFPLCRRWGLVGGRGGPVRRLRRQLSGLSGAVQLLADELNDEADDLLDGAAQFVSDERLQCLRRHSHAPESRTWSTRCRHRSCYRRRGGEKYDGDLTGEWHEKGLSGALRTLAVILLAFATAIVVLVVIIWFVSPPPLD
jgi:hypothetical protein